MHDQFPDHLLVPSGRTLGRGFIVVYMDVDEITPFPQEGLFLERYKMSWAAFDPLEPENRIVVDSHRPKGLHIHSADGSENLVSANTMVEALLIFEKEVEKFFGELEERIYENLHI